MTKTSSASFQSRPNVPAAAASSSVGKAPPIDNVFSPRPPASVETWTPAARLLRPQGRHGELLADPLSDLPGLFEPGRRVSIGTTSPAPDSETTIESHWSPTGRNAGRIVLKLAGVDSISAAELLAGRELLILSSELPELEPDTWFVRDLLGCQLFDCGTVVGEITGVEYPMAPDGRTRIPDAAPLLQVTPAGASRGNEASGHPAPALIPFVKAWLDSVDIEQKRVSMHLPPGLIQAGADKAGDSERYE